MIALIPLTAGHRNHIREDEEKRSRLQEFGMQRLGEGIYMITSENKYGKRKGS